MSKKSKLIISTIIGGAVGSVIGLLVAPENNADIRKKAKQMSDAHKDDIKDIAEGVQKKAKRLASEIKRTLEE